MSMSVTLSEALQTITNFSPGFNFSKSDFFERTSEDGPPFNGG